MTKRKSKSRKSTVKAAAAKGSVRRSSTAPATASPPLIVLGFDDQQKPRGARFVDAKPDLVTKAADLLGFKVYEASSEDVAEYAKKLPLGRLYANGRGFVPNIRQSLYSDLVVNLGQEPQAALSKNGDKDSLPAARGLPRSWDEIGAWPSRHRPGGPRIRLVGSHRPRPARRHLHPTVPGLPAPAQVRPASDRHCDDEPAYRRSQACGSSRPGLIRLGSQSRTQTPSSTTKSGGPSWTARLRASAR